MKNLTTILPNRQARSRRGNEADGSGQDRGGIRLLTSAATFSKFVLAAAMLTVAVSAKAQYVSGHYRSTTTTYAYPRYSTYTPSYSSSYTSYTPGLATYTYSSTTYPSYSSSCYTHSQPDSQSLLTSAATRFEEEDGLLTGLEASLLNLQGTELVILSACDSGTGEVKIGEGVMSLRRAFRIAGAETVLASHWKVSDQATSQLMTEFMRRWRAGQPRAKAWREAQLSLLRSKGTKEDFSNPYFWAAFTLTGQW